MSEHIYLKEAGLNGSFERTSEGLPVNWNVYTPRTVENADFSIAFDKSRPHHGDQSLLFSVRSCSSAGGRYAPGFFKEIPAHAGDVYDVSLWVKNRGSRFRVNITAVSPFRSSAPQSTVMDSDFSEWHRLNYSYTIPPGMSYLRIEVNVLKPGSFWIDDLTVSSHANQ